jgi:hypothetical protein
MAKLRKTSEAFERPPKPPVLRPRTEMRDAIEAETNQSIDAARERIMSFHSDGGDAPLPGGEGGEVTAPPPPPEPAPLGGKQPEGDGAAAKPPVAITSPEPAKPGEIPTPEQLEERLDTYKPGKQADAQHFKPLKDEVRKSIDLARDWHDRAVELQTKLKEAEGKIVPEAEINRLRTVENILASSQVDKLPMWEEYDKAVQETEKSIVTNLTGLGVPANTIKAIQDRGGVVAFSSSQTPAGPTFKNDDGTPMTRAQWFQRNVIEKHNLTELDKTKLASLINKATDKLSEKTSAMETAKQNASETLKKQGEGFWAKFNEDASENLKTLLPAELKKYDFPIAPPTLKGTETAAEKADIIKLQEEWQEADKEVVKVGSMLGRAGVGGKEGSTIALKVALYDAMARRFTGIKAELEKFKTANAELQKFVDGIKDARKLPKTKVVQPLTPPPEQLSTAPTEERLAAAGFKA